MELHTHICSRCNAEHVGGNATLPPPGWEWHGSALICGDCNTAASFMAHSSASIIPPASAPQVKEPFTLKPKPMVDASGLHSLPRDPFNCNLWQIECNFHNSHRFARTRTLTVGASDPVEAYAKVSPMIARMAPDLASINITPAPIDARQAPALAQQEQRIAA